MFKISEHIDKISWTIADKIIFLLYGFVNLTQIKFLGPTEAGKYTLLIMANTWIMAIADSFGLQAIIQFGARKEQRPRILAISLINYLSIILFGSITFWILRGPLSTILQAEYINQIANYILILSLTIAFRSYSQKIMYREFYFKAIFISDLVFFGILTIFTIYYIFSQKYLTWELLTQIYIGAALTSSLVSLFLVKKHLIFSFKGEIKYKEMFNFSFPMAINSLLYNIPRTVEVFIIKYFFPIETVGVYSSAKTLFRVFDEIGNAVYGLIYPAATKLVQNKDIINLRKLMTKSTSFLFLFIIVLVIPLELGFADILIKGFLSQKFVSAIPLFKFLLIGSLAFPFIAQSLILISANDQWYLIKVLIVSNLTLVVAILFVGLTQSNYLLPLGVVLFNFTSGILYYFRIKKKFDFEIKSIFSSIPDTFAYLKEKISKV